MASEPKPRSAHTDSARLACYGPAIAPKQVGVGMAHTAWPAAGRGPRPRAAHARCDALEPGTLGACAVAQFAVDRWWPNLSMVYTARFPNPQCTRLTRLRAPAQSEEGGRRRGRTNRRNRWRRSSTTVKVSPSWFGKQL
jgi:hypothetical protein